MRKNWKTFFIVIFIMVLASCGGSPEYLPKKFFGLEQSRLLKVEEAEKYVDKLHIEKVAGETNKIGFYEGEKGKAVIYVTFYDDVVKPKQDETKMTEKISPENSAFVGGEYIEIRNEKIYRCYGMGQTHFVFSHQHTLLWISAETHWAQEFLQEYLDYIG